MWLARIVESRDPDEFVSLIRPDGCELLVTERGAFKARGTFMDIGRLYAQRRYERLSRIVDVDMPRSGIIFLTEPGPSLYWDGAEIRDTRTWRFSAPETRIVRDCQVRRAGVVYHFPVMT